MTDLDETFKGNLCSCEHKPHGKGKCYEMNYNGAVWSNCLCQETKQDFCMILTPNEFENVSKFHDNRRLARAA